LLFCNLANAQYTRYIVRLKDKSGTPHTIGSPSTYLSAKSISRRSKYNISIDSTDLPITPRYIDSIRNTPGVIILNYSKWLNQVAIQTSNAAAITKINSFPFVISTTGIASRWQMGRTSLISYEKLEPSPIVNNTTNTNETNQTQTLNYGNSFGQVNIHNGQFLHDLGFLGNNMTIAMMDAGFKTYLTNIGIDSLRINNQIKGTWDFVANEASVNEDDAHGFYCLSIIGANKPGQMIGTAPKSNFYLYRTEDVSSEYPIEEQNWAAAAEHADSIGVDIFSTSLGYIDFDNASLDYTYPQRNGNTALMTKAGDLAAKKGILVCNSAGNNGNGSGAFIDYKYAAVPADGDSILAVGACNVAGVIANSSAWGPNSNGKIKPNVTSVGVATTYFNTVGTTSNGNGTSFSNPNIVGLLSGLWQAFPELSNMGILTITQESSHIFAAPDGRYGYGIPNMKKAFVLGLKKVFNHTSTITDCKVNINFTTKDNGISQYELQRKLPNETAFNPIKTLNAAIGTFALKNYNFKDTITSTNFGTVTYRIKHTMGTDTSFTYNDISLNHTIGCATAITPINTFKIIVAPNPIQNRINIDFGTLISNKLKIRLINNNGTIVMNRFYTSTNNLTLNSANLAIGIYQLEIWDNAKMVFSKKLIKSN
jgi:hypothetical protein